MFTIFHYLLSNKFNRKQLMLKVVYQLFYSVMVAVVVISSLNSSIFLNRTCFLWLRYCCCWAMDW
ncbi:hypothetical protein H8356DRAFT_1277860 [Neocallimastix lanati (nom. inval.)]|uniref:Uncharacterized protein n=1 Tax=Neocallimastix californiae TaxID=1754190 RepID=A0A1Y2CD75_9FUNG|nr:hypothetical protein H8356DRAFT_1277860 [Neocallimastix sp. JGI-2020a]ORY44999.1 hypothetical protein LY90DRAFT_20710 [Neocallimastix californiae]|eukprot:ORY44999.1 hypothetical protein LY90DRAFT_20710 [Neocallimastix californiae]